jgi:hypothetical protein
VRTLHPGRSYRSESHEPAPDGRWNPRAEQQLQPLAMCGAATYSLPVSSFGSLPMDNLFQLHSRCSTGGYQRVTRAGYLFGTVVPFGIQRPCVGGGKNHPQIRITARPLLNIAPQFLFVPVQFPSIHFTPIKMACKQLISGKISEKLTIPLDFGNCRG